MTSAPTMSTQDPTNPPSNANPHEGVPGDPLADHYIPAMPVKGEIFEETRTFADLGLRNSVMKGIDACGFKHPTITQSQFIPPIIAGRDVLGQAKTGTGKTAAFGLPLLHLLEKDTPFQALILAPTRELAIQITDEITRLSKFTPIRTMTLYGGQAVRVQAGKLERGAEIIVGTPGRVMDMLERGLLHFKNIKAVVLDEVDRMLDIGFREDIRKILDQTPPGRQTVLVSATISPEIEKLARKYLRDPEKIVVASGSLTVSMVKQYYLPVNQWDKKKLLLHLLRHEEPALTLVFCRLKRTVDELATGLTQRGIESHAIHGDMPQGKRNKTMQALRGGQLSVLICSDLAARGIDVEGVSHVINFDIPEDPEVYVHRIGRTARAGRGGVAWTFVTPEQGELLTNVENLINAEVPKLEYPDFAPSAPPEGWRGEAPGGRREGGLTLANSPDAPAATPPKTSRFESTLRPDLPPVEPEKVDPNKFPGGIVPTKLPPKRLIRGYKTGR
ncbi:MAG: DEAD/DEAH box helicase [Phycisphaerales bacterium]|nr:DEAD/DEAH box helicase [Phycisphaerales bacterium]